MFFPSSSFDGGKFWIRKELAFRDFQTLDDAVNWGAVVLPPDKDKQKLNLFRQRGEVGLSLSDLLN